MSRPRRTLLVAVAAGLVLAAVALVTAACGPSELARAYEPYASGISTRLESEARVWGSVADLAADQVDALGVGRYRAYLETKAAPFYGELERGVSGLVPGHARLDAVNAEVLAFVRLRKEFVDRELRRLAVMGQPEVAKHIAEVERTQNAADEASYEYLKLVVDDAPDPRYSQLEADKKAFLDGPLRAAIDGRGDTGAARDFLEKRLLPRIRKLRQESYEDTEPGRAFRECVVRNQEYYEALALELPTVIDGARVATGVKAVIDEAEARRARVQKMLREVRRDM